MRHEKSANLIELARELAVSRMGLTLDEMAQRMGVGRRTAERMRDQLLLMFDSMEEISDPPKKRWRISGRFDSFLQAPSAKEMAALKLAYEQLEKQNSSSAGALKELENKMMAAIGPKLSRLAPDIEALMQAEAIALTPGPKPKYDAFTLNILRDAILMLRQVSFIYEGGSKAGLRREVVPYGILFGGEAYLIAVEAEKQKNGVRPKVWRIDRIRDAIVSNQSGGPPEDFSLREFAERSFGVFQENEIHEVVLEILPDYAEEAQRWVFHPNQKIKELKNGGLEINMRGASLKELSWVLFRWGGKLKIIAPKELKDEMKKALEFGAELISKKKK